MLFRSDAPSGYASLGPFGGDGDIYVGSADEILSFGTSMDDNLNYYGYSDMITNSPDTDSLYTTNSEYPNWEYYALYRLSLRSDAFGTCGYGDVMMTSVHASPAKHSETVTVKEGPPPSDSTDVFTRLKTDLPGDSGDVPDVNSPDGDPPTDTSDTQSPPPDDGTDTLTNPPSDTTYTDTLKDPPTDPSDSTSSPPDTSSDTTPIPS